MGTLSNSYGKTRQPTQALRTGADTFHESQAMLMTCFCYLGKGNGYPLEYSCLRNSMDRGACRATVHRVKRVGHDLLTTVIGGQVFSRVNLQRNGSLFSLSTKFIKPSSS